MEKLLYRKYTKIIIITFHDISILFMEIVNNQKRLIQFYYNLFIDIISTGCGPIILTL